MTQTYFMGKDSKWPNIAQLRFGSRGSGVRIPPPRPFTSHLFNNLQRPEHKWFRGMTNDQWLPMEEIAACRDLLQKRARGVIFSASIVDLHENARKW